MNDSDLVDYVDRLLKDDIFTSGSYRSDNEALSDRYEALPYGDEEEGLSQILTTEVADTVDADMVSIVRVFMGGDAPIEFVPINSSPAALREAEDKNAYIKHIMTTMKGAYRKQFDWLKEMEIQKMGWIEYGIEEKKQKIRKCWKGISRIEAGLKLEQLESDKDIQDVEVEETIILTSDGVEESIDIEVTAVKATKEFFIENIPWEDFICSKAVQCKDDADIVGKRFRKTRGALLAEMLAKDEGLTKEKAKEKINEIPIAGQSESDSVKDQRYDDEGGKDNSSGDRAWASQLVEGEDVYALIDKDDTGIAERRHIVKVGKILLEDEPFDHIPFAGGSVIPMPHNIVGKSRAEISCAQQRISTVFSRHISDNASAVNQGRAFLDTKTVNVDDYIDSAKHGIIRVKGSPRDAVYPDPVMYHGDKTLQVLAHFDSLQAKRTGQMLTNQALTSDQLHKETATRFRGLERAASGKIELVVRNIAEICYKDLYEGLVWFAQTYQDSDIEFSVFGRDFMVNPSSWQLDSRVQATVGTGFDDDEQRIATLLAMADLIQKEIELGTGLADANKKYNVYKQLVKASGLHDVNMFFNDPKQPEALIYAQNEVLKAQLQQLQAQLEDPLSKAERIKQQGSIQRDQLKYAFEAAMKQADIKQEEKDRMAKVFLDTAKLELEYDQDLPGGI